jgi:hypothetical protein
MPHAHLVHRIPRELQGHPGSLGAATTIGLLSMLLNLPVVYEGTVEISDELHLLEAIQESCPEAELVRLDDLIIEEAETYGPLLTTSRVVLWRQTKWSSAQFLRWGNALAKWRSVREGARAVIDDAGWREFRENTVDELKASGRALQELIRRPPRTRIQRGDLARMWRKLIDENPNGFGHLRANLTSFLDFVADEQAPSNQLIAISERKPFSAPLLFGEWWGQRTHRPHQNLSEIISRLKESPFSTILQK